MQKYTYQNENSAQFLGDQQPGCGLGEYKLYLYCFDLLLAKECIHLLVDYLK